MSHFNSVANTWDTEEKILQNEKYAQIIKSRINKNEFHSVLEFGCGTGLLGANFINSETHFLGIDTSLGMLEVFNKKFSNYPNASGIKLNLEEEQNTLGDKKFELIITSMAFHHLKDPQKMLSILKSLLTNNGHLVIIDLDEEDGTFHPDPKNMGVHHFGFSKLTIDNFAKNAEFKNCHREIINTIKKESGDYPIFMAIFH